MSEQDPVFSVNDPGLWHARLPRLAESGHKYDRGHAVVVSAGLEASGAARLAARAALRIGAGLATVATPPAALPVHAAALTAVMVLSFEGPGGLTGLLADPRKNAIVIGPGLPPDETTRALVQVALAGTAQVVIDAGGLSAFAGDAGMLFGAIRARPGHVVLTPHEGEFARLFHGLAGSRESRAEAAANLSGAVVVLKGAGTVIAAPGGRLLVDRNGPPTLATAGSGDVLAGMIGGLLAQGMPTHDASAAAVWMHGAAARRFGPGLISEDLEAMLPGVLAALYAGPDSLIEPQTR